MEATVSAISADGVWRFEDGEIRSATEVVEVPTIDFFERWTLARFLPGGQLALAFESSQPWSEWGSYGSRYGGVEVMALTEQPATWEPVALEFDYREYKETFEPEDVVFHPRGVLAWLRDGEIEVQVLAAPRGVVPWDLLPERDSDMGLAFTYSVTGPFRTMSLDEKGTLLTATGADGAVAMDLERYRLSWDGGEWESLQK